MFKFYTCIPGTDTGFRKKKGGGGGGVRLTGTKTHRICMHVRNVFFFPLFKVLGSPKRGVS